MCAKSLSDVKNTVQNKNEKMSTQVAQSKQRPLIRNNVHNDNGTDMWGDNTRHLQMGCTKQDPIKFMVKWSMHGKDDTTDEPTHVHNAKCIVCVRDPQCKVNNCIIFHTWYTN